MAELPWLARFLEPLERLGFEYAVTGSVAAMLSGDSIDSEWVEREVNARGLQDAWRSAQPEP